MNNTSYADYDYYNDVYDGSVIPTENEAEKNLEEASRQIDSMTYNRIQQIGFDNLTEFQKDIIRKVNCHLADFDYSNADLLNSLLSSYGINGVSMKMDNNINIVFKNGVLLPANIYNYLEQTGLACSNLRW